jgi:hypothetical protein
MRPGARTIKILTSIVNKLYNTTAYLVLLPTMRKKGFITLVPDYCPHGLRLGHEDEDGHHVPGVNVTKLFSPSLTLRQNKLECLSTEMFLTLVGVYPYNLTGQGAPLIQTLALLAKNWNEQKNWPDKRTSLFRRRCRPITLVPFRCVPLG